MLLEPPTEGRIALTAYFLPGLADWFLDVRRKRYLLSTRRRIQVLLTVHCPKRGYRVTSSDSGIHSGLHKVTSTHHSIEKETVCSSASDGGFQLDTFDDVIEYNTGKSLLCFLKIGGNHEVQLLQLL